MSPALHRRAFLASTALGVAGAATPGRAGPGGPAVAWQYRFPESAAFRASLPLADGSALLAGETTGGDPLVLRVDASGTVLGRWTAGVDGEARIFDVARTSDGGLLLAGRDDAGLDGERMALKLDGEGRLEWETRPEPAWARFEPFAVAEFEPGRYAVCSHRETTETATGHVTALDAAGERLWNREYQVGHGHDTNVAGVLATEDASVRLVGELVADTDRSWEAGSSDVAVLDADGELDDRGGFGFDANLAASAGDGFVTAGRPPDDEGGTDFERTVLAAHGPDGTVDWRTVLDASFRHREVLQTADGGIVVAGDGGTDAFVSKAGGRDAWSASYLGTGTDVDALTAVAVSHERFLVGGRLDDRDRGWVALLEGGDGAARVSVPTSTPAEPSSQDLLAGPGTDSPSPTTASPSPTTETPSPGLTSPPSPTARATLTVARPTDGTPTSTTTPVPGFGALAAAVGFAAAALARVRGSRET